MVKNKQLTPEEINEFCNQTIYRLKNVSAMCLCYALKGYLESKGIYDLDESYEDASLFIPEFTNENAVKYANGNRASYNSNPWWCNGDMFNDKYFPTASGFDFNNRILFLEWLKEQYPITLKENLTPEENITPEE